MITKICLDINEIDKKYKEVLSKYAVIKSGIFIYIYIIRNTSILSKKSTFMS